MLMRSSSGCLNAVMNAASWASRNLSRNILSIFKIGRKDQEIFETSILTMNYGAGSRPRKVKMCMSE